MTNLRNPAKWLTDLLGGKAGNVPITAESTLSHAAYFYGINKISGNVGTLPLNVLRNLDPGAEKDKNHPAYRLLRKRPNRYQTPMVFKQTETARAIHWGNSRSYIHRAGNSSELIPLRPDATITGMVEGEVWHCTMPEKDDRILLFDDFLEAMRQNRNKTVMIPDEDVLHIKGFGDGVNGLSIWRLMRTSFEISLGSDKRAADQTKKGFTGKIFFETDSPYYRDEKKATEFLKDVKKKHGADAMADEVGLLIEGMKANVLNMSNRDAQFIEQRKFQRQEAALMLMLESILGDDTSVSYNSEEQKQLSFLKNCLANWLTRWEEECNYKLLSDREFAGDTHYCKFNTNALLRTDAATTMTTLTGYIQNRVMSPNEVRSKLDENPVPGLDTYENPNITPGSSEPAAAIVDRLQHLMTVEENNVNKMLDRGDTYEQIDKWYENKWVETLGNAIENLGGNRVLAQNHCIESLKYLKAGNRKLNLHGSAEQLAKEIE